MQGGKTPQLAGLNPAAASMMCCPAQCRVLTPTADWANWLASAAATSWPSSLRGSRQLHSGAAPASAADATAIWPEAPALLYTLQSGQHHTITQPIKVNVTRGECKHCSTVCVARHIVVTCKLSSLACASSPAQMCEGRLYPRLVGV